jgi:hypothetical protein
MDDNRQKRRGWLLDRALNCLVLLIFVGNPITTIIGVAAMIASIARWPFGASKRYGR